MILFLFMCAKIETLYTQYDETINHALKILQ